MVTCFSNKKLKECPSKQIYFIPPIFRYKHAVTNWRGPSLQPIPFWAMLHCFRKVVLYTWQKNCAFDLTNSCKDLAIEFPPQISALYTGTWLSGIYSILRDWRPSPSIRKGSWIFNTGTFFL